MVKRTPVLSELEAAWVTQWWKWAWVVFLTDKVRVIYPLGIKIHLVDSTIRHSLLEVVLTWTSKFGILRHQEQTDRKSKHLWRNKTRTLWRINLRKQICPKPTRSAIRTSSFSPSLWVPDKQESLKMATQFRISKKSKLTNQEKSASEPILMTNTGMKMWRRSRATRM